jgi:hypothetical protein
MRKMDFFLAIEANIVKISQISLDIRSARFGEKQVISDGIPNCWEYTNILQDILGSTYESSSNILIENVDNLKRRMMAGLFGEKTSFLINYNEPGEHWLFIVRIPNTIFACLFEIDSTFSRSMRVLSVVDVVKYIMRVMDGTDVDTFYSQRVTNRKFLAIYSSYVNDMTAASVMKFIADH